MPRNPSNPWDDDVYGMMKTAAENDKKRKEEEKAAEEKKQAEMSEDIPVQQPSYPPGEDEDYWSMRRAMNGDFS